MLFLLNRERVVAEMLELARRLIASRAQVAPEEVTVSCEWKADRIVPSFSLQTRPGGALEAQWYQEAISGVWTELRPELHRRLQGLDEVRYGSVEWFRKKGQGRPASGVPEAEG